ncbi:NAD-dependent epimerase/dehydratase family protein [Capnocytophaga sp. 051621]|jgi:NAD-dependent epimerase/dehydratase|uniref:NAD-dependent epimerase/dehydratase family protein n=1 Tax=Capnocytophaga periodontitidis TaxID=2795027 RepID=A0ABS0SPU7_9FLAO|nr:MULTISPECIES: NAD-dependent epimerase/dehydratase family protein [Capnocytophaga]MBI1647710.1 NAD-dependent epimerase/dehydratase family protein [Capnocytophaga periodontitidis]MBM0662932.1 NAD-dependent epimerase/dehydratase family protein [Capnocytophaga genosp. AHN8471]
MEKILITGGAGFIGSNLALTLLKRGHQVTVLDNLSEQIHGKNPEKTSSLYLSIKDKVHFIKGTVACRETLQKAIADNTVVVHLAAETGTGQSMYEIQHYTDVNIGATALLLDILTNEKHLVKKVVVASSRAIYGEGKYYNKTKNTFVYPLQRTDEDMQKGDFEVKDPQNHSDVLELVATTEDAIIHPTSVYGITKQVQEQLVMTVCPTIGIAGVAFRYQNVYGPGQSLKNPYTGILSIFSTQIKNGNGINIFEDGKETRDFVFISDVVDATVLGIEKETANNQVFNVGTGVATDVITVAKELSNNYGIQVLITISGNYRLGDIRHNYADITKARQLLGFDPKISFKEGLKQFTDWVNTQEVEEDKYQQSIDEMKAKGLYK